MATLILGAVGAAIGVAGGPAGAWRGFQIGASIGSLLEAGRGGSADIGRLTDLHYSGSSYGASIPRVWGKARVGGNVVWVATDSHGNHLIEHSASHGGGKKSGGSVTQYSYTATFAVAFCEGDHAMPNGDVVHRSVSLTRLWADDKVVWEAGATTNTVSLNWYDGSDTQAQDATIVAKEGSNTPAYRGIAYAVIADMDLTDFGNRIPNMSAEVETGSVTLGAIASDLARLSGIGASSLDVTLAGTTVSGFMCDAGSAGLDCLKQLLTAYAFDAVEVDGKLTLIPRGGDPTITIGDADLGATSGGGAVSSIERVMASTTELPGRVDVLFRDLDRDFQQATQYETRQYANVQNAQQLSLNLSLTADEARAIASRTLDTAWLETEEIRFSLPPKYLSLAPGDVVSLRGMRLRVVETGLAPLGELQVRAVPDDAGVLVTSAPGDGGGSDPSGSRSLIPVPTTFIAWSGPELKQEDQSSAGFYVAANGPAAWVGGSIFYSTDGGTTYISAGSVAARSVFGSATTTLSSSGTAGSFDDTHTVDVTLSFGSLASAPDAQVLIGQNACVLGSEIVGIGTVTLLGTLQYRLSHLLRGERGTSLSSHTSSERFVLVSNSIARVPVDASLVGTTVLVKIVSRYQTLADVTEVSVTITARTELPVESDVSSLSAALTAHEATIAAAGTLGHVKVGSGLSIDGSGVLNATGISLSFADSESPSGTIDGANTAFTLAHSPSPTASLKLFLNGLELQSGSGKDYTLSGAAITTIAPPQTGDVLLAWYRY